MTITTDTCCAVMKPRLPLLLATLPFLATSLLQAGLDRNTIYRGNLQNSLIQFEKEKTGRVAFMGGSITQMEGYRPILAGWLQKKFPETKFEFINAGISSTCSTTGAFRLQDHVLDKGRIDLFFVEFAVNDDQDARHTRQNCIRGMEGIIRQARTLQPEMDIICTHFVNPGMLKTLQEGRMPLPMAAHEMVLQHYGVSTNFAARELADRIEAGTMSWKQFGGTHPGKAGNAMAAEGATRIMEAAWSRTLDKDSARKAHRVPSSPLDEGSYINGHFLSPGKASQDKGFSYAKPDWKKIPGGFRNTFAGMKLLCADKADSETTIKFEGRTLGAYLLAGPDAGILETSINGGEFTPVDLYHNYSRGLHYPRTVILASDLNQGNHTARIRVAAKGNPQSKGTAARILQFGVN
jgi:lysophospholipase L1-like esterase